MNDGASGKGLELARALWEASREELFAGEMSVLAKRAAAGLVGEGSECFGYDDVTSRDHDWGPGYCVWLAPVDYAAFGQQLQLRYAEIERRGLDGLARPETRPRRTGVFSITRFYEQLLKADMPSTFDDWRSLDETALAAATNGELFCDGLGEFTQMRNRLLAYYPEDIRLRKIARGCLVAAQSGQYNLMRQAKRGEELSALAALAAFSDAIQQIVFALARRYKPFYKWSSKMLGELGILGQEARFALDGIAALWRAGEIEGTTALIEALCAHIAEALAGEGLVDEADPWLVSCAEQVNARIDDPAYRATSLFEV